LIGDHAQIGPPCDTRKIFPQGIARRIDVKDEQIGAIEPQIIDN
jgi:hypothetical protein